MGVGRRNALLATGSCDLGADAASGWHLQRINRTFGQTCALTTYGGAPWACQTADAVLKEVTDPAEQCFMLRRYQDLLRTGDIGNLQRQLDEDLLHVLSGTATQTTGAATGRSH